MNAVTITATTAQVTPIREGIAGGPTGRGQRHHGVTVLVSIGNCAVLRRPGSAEARSTILAIPYRTGP